MKFSSPIATILLPSLLLLLVLRLIFWFTTFPNPDEAYYWLWGQHPDLSYYDHPPLQAWVQGLFTAIFGKSLLVLRLPNLISNTTLFYFYYLISAYLYGDRKYQYFGLTIALLLTSPLYFLFLALAWHDHLLITFSLIACYLFIQFLDEYSVNQRGATWRLYLAAMAIGCAVLCKYNAIFVVGGLIATVISKKNLRRLLCDRRFYIASLITISFLLPIALWNWDHHFQSFQYYLHRSVDPGSAPDVHFQIKLGEPLVFLLVSLLTVSPINVWAILRVIRHPRLPFQRTTIYYTAALWVFGLSTGLLTAIAFFSTALYYWNITAYLLLFPLLPSIFLRQTTLIHKPLLIAGQAYGLLFAALLVIHYSFFPLSALGSPDADPDSRMLFGWDTVQNAIQSQLLESKQPLLLLTTDYRSASALAYQLNNPNIFAISDRIDQFDFWHQPNQLRGKNALILTDDWHPATPKLLNQFTQTTRPTTIPITRFGKWIKNYYLLKGYTFKDPPSTGLSSNRG